MAKKVNARELREQKKAQDKERFRKINQENITKPQKQTISVGLNEDFASYEKADGIKEKTQKSKKTLAKANGLKSAFVVNDDIYLTAFGKGNSAIVEKHADDRSITDINKDPNYAANYRDGEKLSSRCKIEVQSNRKSNNITLKAGISDKPQNGPARSDILQMKDKLEVAVYGRTFDDNIHIQIIYNILDIRKILSVYSNIVVVTINNVFRHEMDNDDFIGGISTRYTYREFMDSSVPKNAFNEIVTNDRLCYFGDLFNAIGAKKPDTEAQDMRLDCAADWNDREYKYNIFALLGALRQDCTHSKVKTSKAGKTSTWLFNLEGDDGLDCEFKRTLDFIFENRFSKLGKDFLETSGINIRITENALNATSLSFNFDEFIADYYEFTILKSYKNLGFSIRELREKMLDIEACRYIRETDYNSVRSKIYRTMDYLIYRFAKANSKLMESMICELRASLTDQEKESIYASNALKIFNILKKETITGIVDDAVNLSKETDIKEEFKKKYRNYKLKNFTAKHYFTKLMFLVTKFLDGKDINSLITELINKFDNIASFIETETELKISANFQDEFLFFKNSKVISDELRLINSVSRMTSEERSAKKIMYRDALEVLGVPDTMSDEQINAILDDVLGYDENGNKTKSKGQHGYRNFIASNVIDSRRFRYLVKFCNTKTIKKIANNKNIMTFAISKLPQEQIDRYYENCGGSDMLDTNDKIKWLAGKIHGFNYKYFEDIDNSAESGEMLTNKQEKQTLISFYLTILYHIIKNLVYVNSRYLIAIYRNNFDTEIVLGRNNSKEELSLDLTKYYVDSKKINSYACRYLSVNICNLEDKTMIDAGKRDVVPPQWILGRYRNHIAHLSVARNASKYLGKLSQCHSYFEMYHFIMQNIMKDECTSKDWYSMSKTFDNYFKNIDKYGTYSKDLVKALNTPFGYCLARYKNLSIEPLFDRNDMRIEGGEKEYKTAQT